MTVLTGRPYYPAFRLTEGYERGQRDRETVSGVEIVRSPTIVPKQGRALYRIISELNYLLRAAGKLATGAVRRSDRVVSFSPSVLAVLAGVLATRRGGRHLAVVHDIQSGLAVGLGMVRASAVIGLMKAVETFALNRADQIVVLSDRMKSALERQGVRRPIEVIPLWVDPEAIHPLVPADRTAPVVLYSGNLGRKQGLDQVLAMAEILLAKRPDTIVTIRGAGAQGGSIEDEARQRGLSNMRFEPLLPIEQLNEGLASGDLHLVPQNPDAADFAVPSKVYNIMAAGRPIVATALPGSTLAALAEETVALVCSAPNDPEAFANEVIALIDDPVRRAGMGAKGREYVEATTARDVVLARYACLLCPETAND